MSKRRTLDYVLCCYNGHSVVRTLPAGFTAQEKHPAWLEGCAVCFGAWQSRVVVGHDASWLPALRDAFEANSLPDAERGKA